MATGYQPPGYQPPGYQPPGYQPEVDETAVVVLTPNLVLRPRLRLQQVIRPISPRREL